MSIAGVTEAFQGEVFGMAMYRAIADVQVDPWRRWQWECLHCLEVELSDDLAALLRRHGVDPNPDPAEVDAGRSEAERILGLPWPELLDEFAVDLPELIEAYSALTRTPGFTVDDVAIIQRLVDHEVAALDYCRAELAGEGPERSISPVVRLLRSVPPAPEDTSR